MLQVDAKTKRETPAEQASWWSRMLASWLTAVAASGARAQAGSPTQLQRDERERPAMPQGLLPRAQQLATLVTVRQLGKRDAEKRLALLEE